MTIDRRQFLKLAAAGGGAVFASALPGCASLREGAGGDFHFVQLSDSHWGFEGPAVNPDPRGTLPRAIAAVNALDEKPDFIVFTGDLTHSTDNPLERRRRMREVRDLVAQIHAAEVHFMPGEHDAALDHGKAFMEIFGPTRYTFEHKGVRFIVLDNVSDPAARIGAEQLAWLRSVLAPLPPETPIVVLTHRPLFDLAPAWDWATRDGADAIALLMPYPNVTVFYGHIHQENHHVTGHIAHHAAKGLMFPLPAPGSQPKRDPVPWDPMHPYRGLGIREVDARPPGRYALDEVALAGG